MASPALILVFLLTVSFTLATQLVVWREQSVHQQTRSGSMLEILMGDSRRLFANHFVTKADVYLHGGVYPSIFDQAQRENKTHLSQAAENAGVPGSEKDSIEAAHEEANEHHKDHDHGEEHEDAVS